MNIVEKMDMEARLRKNLAENMTRRGRIISDREQSNYYTCCRITEVFYRNALYRLVYVDGMACLIEETGK